MVIFKLIFLGLKIRKIMNLQKAVLMLVNLQFYYLCIYLSYKPHSLVLQVKLNQQQKIIE